MRRKVLDEAQEKAAKRLLRKVVEEETAKFLTRGGLVKNGPRVARPTTVSEFSDTPDFSEYMGRYLPVMERG